ncbi:unnamed protein product [Ceratitis capitata]|uniref:(Mediterranean fruit fly) hypothetical protein n=1 Tax=Ceratitis capitata TaxID=7213 RepID=A0A811UPH4_CERCA|nr:unnamed protein product [Ceratitis capitata]
MSFSDWKQMKDAEEVKQSPRSDTGKPFTSQFRQNHGILNLNKESPIQNQHYNNNTQIFRPPHKNKPSFNSFPQNANVLNYNAPNLLQNLPNFMPENNQHNWQNYNSHSQQQNSSNFIATTQNEAQQNTQKSFRQDTMNSPRIPPLKPPMSFDEFIIHDQYWSSGPLMQPMLPPMPRMPRLNHQVNRNHKLNQDKRSSARFKPKSGQTTAVNRVSQKTNSNTAAEENAKPLQSSTTQPQIYIERPRNLMSRNDKNKSNWMVKPQAPPPIHATTPEAREEKQRLWREYRQAMKPFKHREFANAKRVVQRLGKKSLDELDEKDRSRLDRAVEYINAHKALLNARMMDRSNRLEKSLQIEKASKTDGSTASNLYQHSASWSTIKDAWNKDNTNDGKNQYYCPPLGGDNASSCFWNPAAGHDAIPFQT